MFYVEIFNQFWNEFLHRLSDRLWYLFFKIYLFVPVCVCVYTYAHIDWRIALDLIYEILSAFQTGSLISLDFTY